MIGAAATAAFLGTLTPRLRAIRAVSTELRTSTLFIPLSLRSTVSLKIGRRMYRAPSGVPAGLRLHERVVIAPGGAHQVPVVIYEPAVRSLPCAALVWMHGGGMVLGNAARDHAMAGRIASELGIVVVSVDYRLAPEHPYPAALQDCATAYDWLLASSDEFHVDVQRIAVGGASAGGGLAAALAQYATDRGVPPAFQMLRYPMLDDRTVLRNNHGHRGNLSWTTASNKFAWTAYLGQPPSMTRSPGSYAAPARRANLADLPPAWIGVGDLDLFRDEDVDYARRLQEAGVSCILDIVPGMYHGADEAVPHASAIRQFRESMLRALSDALKLDAPGLTPAG